MKQGSRTLRRIVIASALCAAVAAVGSVAVAMTSAAGDKIVACASKGNGALRLVTAAKNCRASERAVIWNVAGKQGPAGPAGPRGLAGEDGQDGVDGLDGLDGLDGADGEDGKQGIPGMPGATGPPGPAGAASEPKWRYVYLNTAIAPYAPGLVPTESCSSGVPQAVNGGGFVNGSSDPAAAGAPDVQYGATASRWVVRFGTNNSPYAKQVTVWVLCASGTAG